MFNNPHCTVLLFGEAVHIILFILCGFYVMFKSVFADFWFVFVGLETEHSLSGCGFGGKTGS